MVRACEKTGISQERLIAIIDEVESQLQLQEHHQVTSVQIGEMVLDCLQSLSEVAYVRFASVYRKFQGVKDFAEALNQFEGNPVKI
jgi:transcriptional repressor NrdR